jgi:subtilisin family serine protease
VTTRDAIAHRLVVGVAKALRLKTIVGQLGPYHPKLVHGWATESQAATTQFRVYQLREPAPASLIADLHDPPAVIVERELEFSRAAVAVNDPRYGEQWALERMAVEGAWTCLGAGPLPAPVTVAVVDSGVAAGHPDLAGRIDAASRRFIEPMPDGRIEDEDGHGTFLCGTIAAVTDNALGIASVGGPLPVRIMALKFYDPWTPLDGGRAARAISWAVDNGARVINASWHVGMESATLRAAIEYAAAHDVVVVAAAGNEGENNDRLPIWPASYTALPNVVSVMASDRRDDRPGFSNYGATTVHIAAPGVGVLSTHFSIGGPPAYRTYTGTSVAAAHVSAAAAVVRALAPGMSAAGVRHHLIVTADASRWLPCVAKGRLNVRRAVCALA